MTYLTLSSLEELQDCVCSPPAIAYVRETGNYYLLHDYVPELARMESCSYQGIGWQAMDVSSPRYDRQIHVVKTRSLNGQDLDYYPRYVSASLSPITKEAFEDICGAPGNHENTTIEKMVPGDLILRTQKWEGTVKSIGPHYLGLSGIEGEVSSKYFDATNLPTTENSLAVVKAAYKSLSTLTIEDVVDAETGETAIFNIVDHWPNSRNANPTKWEDQTDVVSGFTTKYQPLQDIKNQREDMWNPAGQDTQAVFVLEELPYESSDEIIGAAVTIELTHWYMVSTEHYQKDFPPETDPESTVAPPGPICWEYTYLSKGDLPARFDRVLFDQLSDVRTPEGLEFLAGLLLQKRAVTGDFTYSHPANGWFQVMAEGTADIVRILTLPGLTELKALLQDRTTLQDLCILLRTNRKNEQFQQWLPQGLTALGDYSNGLTSSTAGVPEVFYLAER